MLKSHGIALFFLYILYQNAESTQDYAITTFVNAKWHQTPLYLEIAEYLAEENPSLYWDFLDIIGSLEVPLSELETESKQYFVTLNIAKKLISPNQFPLLKLLLSMHSLTPRVQTHFQLGEKILKKQNCKGSVLISIGNKISCTLSDLKEQIPSSEVLPINTYSFDHIYPGTENGSIAVIVYSDIGSKEFQEYHQFLKNTAIQKNVKYISRHFIKVKNRQKVRLSGYGVELHLKSTEYKSQDDSLKKEENQDESESRIIQTEINGFDFKILKERYPNKVDQLERFRRNLLDKSEIVPLKAWEFQDLGLLAAKRIASTKGDSSLEVLQKIAQNFPTQTKSLLNETISEEFREEMKHNVKVLSRSLNLQPPDSSLFVNGMFFDVETLDLGQLIETLRIELRVLDSLHNIGIKGEMASSFLTLDFSSSSLSNFAIDIRHEAITWINNIEKDSKYKNWHSSVNDLLRPAFPGMLRSVRKNLFNLVLIVDPIIPETREYIQLAESIVLRMAPIRLGLVFDSRNQNVSTENDYQAISCTFNYIAQKRNGPLAALNLLTNLYSSVKNSKNVNSADLEVYLKKFYPDLRTEKIRKIFNSPEFDKRSQGLKFIEKLGLKNSFHTLLNGKPLQNELTNKDDFEEIILTKVLEETITMQKMVLQGELSDAEDVVDTLMEQENVMPRLNQLILSSDNKYMDLTGVPQDLNTVKDLMQLSHRDITATILSNLNYFLHKKSYRTLAGKQLQSLSILVFANLEEESGRTLLLNALNFMKQSKGVRVGFIPNFKNMENNEFTLNHLLWAASYTLPEEEALELAEQMLAGEDFNRTIIPEATFEYLSKAKLHLKMLQIYCQRVLKITEKEHMIIVNGRIYGPLKDHEIFTEDDFSLVESVHEYLYFEKIKKFLNKKKNEIDFDLKSDSLLKIITTLLARGQTRNRNPMPSDLQEKHTVINLEPRSKNDPHFNIVAVLDPASKAAQKFSSILILLRKITNCNMKVFLCAVEQHSDMPVKNFYQYVIEPEVNFFENGRLHYGPLAKFTGLPQSSLLTQNLQVPENWLVEVLSSVYDLDNIKLIDIGGPVQSEYELEYLLLEGHCFDTTTGAPPRGLQITLGTKEIPVIVDTIVMANLGYFQLKANPGIWDLRLRQGKSADLYDIGSAEGTDTIQQNNTIRIVINSLRSHVIKLKVIKKEDQLHADLLSDDSDSNSGIWNTIANSIGVSNSESDSEVINIFSLASGHLYERLLRIMMLSVLKHTKSPVKFWFLKNYLSPQFKNFLPHMSKEYNFNYELVQYKWPRWLHQQSEKQRTIWGYKILFLDVLFPLNVKKIIFVDADAIVRTNIAELNEMDLNGAPYAYTPFCDSRTEMEGFRFWKTGYWRSHLMGRKYHISALYVVDLKRFRKVAAGDRIRGQYQALSQDPNSLSNLDQDLPNNMIHQVNLKSLPQEWLWCETWCSNESFKNAKVIDLCNNPLTKEAKLTAAQRIVPEWKEYDLELKNLIVKVAESEIEHEDVPAQDDIKESQKHLEL